jgi:hypothetical protein
MSAAPKETRKPGTDPFHIPASHPWAQAWKIAAVCGGIGLALALFGWSIDPHRFAFSWLFAFVTFLTLGLGAIFFIAIQFLTVAHWSVTVRRTAEFFAAGVPVFALLFIPLALPDTVTTLYEWHAHAAEHDEEPGDEPGDEHSAGESLLGTSVAHAQPPEEAHEAGEAHGEHGPQHVLHGRLLEHKRGYLNYGFWLARAAFYLIVWILLGLWLFRSSITQDRTKDKKITARLQKLSPLVLIVFALTLTFAMVDWVMSLEPTWYSTIYGVYIFAGTAVSIHALVAVVTLSLRSRGLLGDAVNVEHYHDLGKMTFGFIVFWAYIGFGQMMLQWYANIPEEIVYYHHRWHAEGWRGVSIFLIFGHFALPFLFLISRNVKRRLALLGFGCTWMLIMHVVDIYWFVMPNVSPGKLAVHWIDLAALLAVGGIYFAVVLYGMRRHALIPLGDPRLGRSLRFHNA